VPNGLKKWSMLQLWRLQQVAQLLTLALLALNLSLQLYDFIKWRGSLFETPYTGVLIIMLILAAIIWGFAFLWDVKFKMWREQQTVLIERNPYAKEKMAAKEIALYELIWLPLLDKLGKDDPKLKEASATLKEWLDRQSREDPSVAKDLKDIYNFMGKNN